MDLRRSKRLDRRGLFNCLGYCRKVNSLRNPSAMNEGEKSGRLRCFASFRLCYWWFLDIFSLDVSVRTEIQCVTKRPWLAQRCLLCGACGTACPHWLWGTPSGLDLAVLIGFQGQIKAFIVILCHFYRKRSLKRAEIARFELVTRTACPGTAREKPRGGSENSRRAPNPLWEGALDRRSSVITLKTEVLGASGIYKQ